MRPGGMPRLNQLFMCWDFTPYNFAKSADRIFASFRRALKRSPLESIFINGKFRRSEEHTSELQSLMRSSYAVFCLKKKKITNLNTTNNTNSLRQRYIES